MKRIIDLAISYFAIFALSPVWIVAAIVIRLQIGKPVLFSQTRPGKRGELFRMYKFRTMTNEVDGNGVLLPDKKRMTQIGSFLRSTSIDELPELINVINGEMSIVGPRPLLPQYLNRYNETQRRRHDVRPGITGLAQISGRNQISWEEKFVLDVWYVDNISLKLDLKIIALTVLKVIRQDGISAAGEATMSEFQGSH